MSATWSGKVVLIPGGAGGIGLATAQAFAARGASIALADLKPAAGMAFHAIATDIRRVADCERMVRETVARFGRLDVLVNAAGVWVEGDADAMTEAQWDQVLDVNLKGTFFASRFAIPHLEKTGGQIVNIASDAGLIGNSGAAIYCASKGGVVLLTKALALELAPRGIRVNAICPCDVETPMLRGQAERFGGGDPDAYLDRLKSQYPQGERTRFARPEEIASFIVAMAEQPAVTGAALSIDFGTTAGK